MVQYGRKNGEDYYPSNDTPKPRKQVLFDLIFLILYRQQHNESIILFIDVDNHLPLSLFQRFCKEVNLIDIIATERDVPPTATHMSGNRIDYILLSPDLAVGTIASWEAVMMVFLGPPWMRVLLYTIPQV